MCIRDRLAVARRSHYRRRFAVPRGINIVAVAEVIPLEPGDRGRHRAAEATPADDKRSRKQARWQVARECLTFAEGRRRQLPHSTHRCGHGSTLRRYLRPLSQGLQVCLVRGLRSRSSRPESGRLSCKMLEASGPGAALCLSWNEAPESAVSESRAAHFMLCPLSCPITKRW